MTSFSAVQVRDLKLCPHLVPVTDSLAASKQAVSLHARQACLLQASKLLHAALSLQLWQKPIWSTPYTPSPFNLWANAPISPKRGFPNHGP